MKRRIYIGEDVDVEFDCFSIFEPENRVDVSDVQVGCCLYTNKFDPIVCCTESPFMGHVFNGGDLLKIERDALDSSKLKFTLRGEITKWHRPGRVTLEVWAKYQDAWKSVGKIANWFEFLPARIGRR